MNSTKELFLQAMREKHGGDFETVKNYIEIFNDMLQEINFTSFAAKPRTSGRGCKAMIAHKNLINHMSSYRKNAKITP